MSTATWVGKDDDWEGTGNWVGGSGAGGIPDDGDDVVFPPTHNQSVFRNLDRATAENLDLNSLIVHKGFGGQIGTSAAPLACTVDGTIKHNGDRPFYFKTDTTSANTTGDIVINSGNRDVGFMLLGDTNVASLLVGRGFYVVSGAYTGTLGKLDQYIEGQAQGLVRGTLESGAAIPSIIVQSGGELNLHNAGNFLAYILAGKAVVHPGASGASAVFRIGPNGTLDYRSASTIVTLMNAGLVTFLNTGLPVTVTDLYRLGGSVIKYDPELVTITNDYRIEGP